MRRFPLSLGLIGWLTLLPVASGTADDEPVSFARDIRPILSDKCFACHGPDENTREAGLRLDAREEAVEADAIVPGKSDESGILQRILSDDEEERMPPRHANKELTPAEIDAIGRWIDEGAKYETHWAYRPLNRPMVPAIMHARNKNAIDAFVIDGLGKRQLELAAPADRPTLVRRLYLDLLGVPPTQAEVDAFLNDESTEAVDDLVDRLLEDRRFGERMAVYWLDLVRYADTIGYHSDTYMEVSGYRDYVIDAFNHNKPFDQFTIEQLAGDLLAEPTDSQLVASGYNRLLQTTEEGGAQAKEYIAIYAADRVRNVSGVWMGSTVGCAQCHDHKYDPFTSRDFYSLAAFFSDIKETAVGKRKPNFKLLSEADKQKREELGQKIADLKLPRLLELNEQLAKQIAAGQKAWEAETLASTEQAPSLWITPTPAKVDATGGVVLARQDDGAYLSTKGNPDKGSYTYQIDASGKVHAVRLEVFSEPGFPNKGFARGNGNIVLTGVSISAGDKTLAVDRAVADFEQNGWPIAHTIDGNKNSGWAIDGHNKTAPKRTAVFHLKEPVEFGDEPGSLTIKLSHQSVHARHLIGRFRISLSDQPSASLDAETMPEELWTAIRTPADERSGEQEKRLADHYRSFSPELAPWKKQLAVAEKELKDLDGSLRTMLVTERLPEPRMTRILPRGNWLDDSGDPVQPAVPEFLPHANVDGRTANRLDLANWLVEDSNPLTSRTFVNRLWKLYFGRGLSPNLDDLGGQGQPPSHPELLDWLAVEFRTSGWDVKHMVRLLVTSSAYTQSSVASKELREIDADNLWYARQGRWRLEAEFVRDTLLQVSGLLNDRQIGGRSVKPYQPAGYWQHLNFPKRTWQAEQGDNLYRRSLYTFWCRTFLHPAMLAFDATSREECTAQRARSNIPQQALVLLNDPEFMEASRVFANRIMDADGSTKKRIRWAFREAVSRQPIDAEVNLLHELYEHQLHRYEKTPADAKALLSVGAAENRHDERLAELAAWTQVARAVFNLYETTSRF